MSWYAQAGASLSSQETEELTRLRRENVRVSTQAQLPLTHVGSSPVPKLLTSWARTVSHANRDWPGESKPDAIESPGEVSSRGECPLRFRSVSGNEVHERG
jgi:hypothetical protein